MHRQTTGSGTDVSDSTRSPTDASVSWFGSGADAGQTNIQPSSPPAINSFERDAHDPT
jgi:hypothetical protein